MIKKYLCLKCNPLHWFDSVRVCLQYRKELAQTGILVKLSRAPSSDVMTSTLFWDLQNMKLTFFCCLQLFFAKYFNIGKPFSSSMVLSLCLWKWAQKLSRFPVQSRTAINCCAHVHQDQLTPKFSDFHAVKQRRIGVSTFSLSKLLRMHQEALIHTLMVETEFPFAGCHSATPPTAPPPHSKTRIHKWLK